MTWSRRTWSISIITEDVRDGPVRKAANLWAAPRLFRDLRAEERCIALNKFMARPRLWSTRSSWRAPRRVFRIEILFPSFSCLLSFPLDAAPPCAFSQKRRSRQNILSIYFPLVKSFPPS